MTDFTIVYITYQPDLVWLRYSLLSLQKFVTGFKELIIYCHDVCCKELYDLVSEIQITCRIIPVSYDYHGYEKAMVVKCMYYLDVRTSYIMTVDSDNIFNARLNVHDLIDSSGVIPWYYLKNMPVNHEGRVWKKAYEDITKTQQDKYYMENNFPFVFTTESLRLANDKFIELHGVNYDTFCKNQCKRLNIQISDKITNRFSDLASIFIDLEWLGFYCQNFSSDYIFIDSALRTTNKPLLQFWSHGGLTDEIKQQIETLLA